MANVLVIKHGALGDVVLAMGTMRALKRMYPEDSFTLMTMRPFVALAEQTGVFDGYIVDNRRPFRCLGETRRVLGEMLAGRFSRIYNMQFSQRTRHYRRLLRLLSPAGKFEWYEYSTGLCHTITKRCRFGVGRQSIAPVSLPEETTDLRFMHGKGEHFHLLPERYVLLIPGCSPQHTYKRWPVENYRDIVRRLAERGINAVVLGTKAEAEDTAAICAGLPSAVNMMGLTELADVPQVALRALAVLGNDTGPSHMAALTGVFTIALFDQRNARSVLRGPDCASIVSPGEVRLISVDEVWQRLEARLSSV